MMMMSAGYDDDVIRMFIGQTFGISSAGGCSSDGSGCADYHAGYIAIWWWRQGDISGNRISCCWRMMMMKSYTSVVRSKSTDMIYAHDLVYKVLKRSSRGACGIMLSCIFEISWWWILAGNGCDAELMFFPRPRVGAPSMAIVAEVWAMAWADLVPEGRCTSADSGAGLEKSSCLLPYLLHSSLGANLVMFERHFHDTVYLAGFLVNYVINCWAPTWLL